MHCLRRQKRNSHIRTKIHFRLIASAGACNCPTMVTTNHFDNANFDIGGRSTSWTQYGNIIVGDDGDALDPPLAMNNDGTALAVGSPRENKIYIYECVTYPSTEWVLKHTINHGGFRLDMSACGKRIVTSEGSYLYVFELDEESNEYVAIFTNHGRIFGNDVSISPDGKSFAAAVEGDASSLGYVKVWSERNFGGTTRWVSIGSFMASKGNFGYSLAVHSNMIVVGSPQLSTSSVIIDVGSVYIYEGSGGIWMLTTMNGLTDDSFGSAVAISEDKEKIAICSVGNSEKSPNPTNSNGYCRVLQRFGFNWLPLGDDVILAKQSLHEVGHVSLSKDGLTLAVTVVEYDESSPQHGTVYIFRFVEEKWVQDDTPIDIVSSGLALASDGSKVAISIPEHGDDGNRGIRSFFMETPTIDDEIVLGTYQCDEDGDAYEVPTSSGSYLTICIGTRKPNSRTKISKITTLYLKSGETVLKTIIENGESNFLTNVDCDSGNPPGSKCIVGTLITPSLLEMVTAHVSCCRVCFVLIVIEWYIVAIFSAMSYCCVCDDYI